MSDYEKRLRSHRKHVIERILTLACPRCSRAFLGFEECFAIKCSAWVKDDPNSCCQFCAYCLKDCGQDAHPHVLDNVCPGNRGLFQSVEVFEDVQRNRRERMLRECVCCCTLFFFVLLLLCLSCCLCVRAVVLTYCVFIFILSSFVYRYLDGIESENERSEVVVDLARELTDLGLDPQMFL